jgi:hypothetical protein
VHLKRFDNFARKIKNFVQYEEYLDLSKFKNNAKKSEVNKYRLCSVLVHQGNSSNSGHYYSYVRVTNDQWCCFNDHSVNIVEKSTVLNQSPYILFYEKILDRNRLGIKKSLKQSNIKSNNITTAENINKENKQPITKSKPVEIIDLIVQTKRRNRSQNIKY